MKLDTTTALGRLLTDPEARQRFAEDPEGWILDEGGDEETLQALAEVEPASLETQAQLLLVLRREAVLPFLPETRARLGPRFDELFARYAAGHHPKGAQRHPLDAAGFLRFLEEQEPASASSEDWSMVHAHLAWRAGRRWFVGVTAHPDHGPLSGLTVVLSGQKKHWRAVVPLPVPSALVRAALWRARRASARSRG